MVAREDTDLSPMELAHTWWQLERNWRVSADGTEFTFNGYGEDKDLSRDALYMSDTVLADGVLEAEIMVEQVVPHGTNAHLVFRFQDPENYLFAGLGGWDHKFVIAERRPQEGKLGQSGWQVLEATGSIADIAPNQWHRLRVEFSKDSIVLYLGGVCVLSHTLKGPRYRWGSGNIGLRAWGLWKARFRNVRSWQYIQETDMKRRLQIESRSAKRRTNVRDGIALAVAAFAISIFLYFRPRYFGALTTGAAIALIVLGFAGLGIELNKITSEELDSLMNRDKGLGIFDNLGIGIALLIVWGALYHYFPITWVNILTFPVLFFGTYGTVLGLFNVLFLVLIKSGSKTASSRSGSDKPTIPAIRIVVVISGLVGFIASLLQILQFFKVIP